MKEYPPFIKSTKLTKVLEADLVIQFFYLYVECCDAIWLLLCSL